MAMCRKTLDHYAMLQHQLDKASPGNIYFGCNKVLPELLPRQPRELSVRNPCECQAEWGNIAKIAEVSFVSLSCIGQHCGICVNVKL